MSGLVETLHTIIFCTPLDKNNQTDKEDRSSGKWTDILMKKDGKWMLVGDHGGEIKNDN